MKLLLPSLMLLIVVSALSVSFRPVSGANPNILYISPAKINSGQAVGSSINFAVKVFQMDPFNAWDMQVAVDPTVLNPTSFTITPNLLTANYSISLLELTHCINGLGNGCTASDTNGVVHSAVFPLGSAPAVPSVSGVMFNITYAVVNPNGFSTVVIQSSQIVSGGVNVPTTIVGSSYGLVPKDNTSTVVACSPSSILAGQTTICTATVMDTASVTKIPSGLVNFTTTGPISPVSSSCTLSSGSCSVTLTGTASGVVTVTGVYAGDLTHNSSTSAGVTITVGSNTTATSLVCTSPVTVGQASTCLASVLGGSVTPTGNVVFTSDPSLLPSSVSCSLSGGSCSVNITTPPGSGGAHNVTASYGGDSAHSSSSGLTGLVVNDFIISASPTALIIPVGASNSTVVSLTSLGAFTGTISLSVSALPRGVVAGLVPNPVTITTGGSTSTSQLTISVAAGVSDFTLTITGTGGGLSRATGTISVHVTSAPVFTGGKLHWIHKLSFSKSSGVQPWSASVSNPTSSSVSVLIRIVGTSQTDPSIGFDVTCGTVCVSTGGIVSPVTIAAGSSLSFSFNQPIPSSFVGNKFSFTATLLWAPAGSTPSTTSDSKSGAFSVFA